jgi:hypothetical protein
VRILHESNGVKQLLHEKSRRAAPIMVRDAPMTVMRKRLRYADPLSSSAAPLPPHAPHRQLWQCMWLCALSQYLVCTCDHRFRTLTIVTTTHQITARFRLSTADAQIYLRHQCSTTSSYTRCLPCRRTSRPSQGQAHAISWKPALGTDA